MMTEQLTTAQKIVADLAKAEPPRGPYGYRCHFCGRFFIDGSDHKPTCPYRRAVEYVESLKAGER